MKESTRKSTLKTGAIGLLSIALIAGAFMAANNYALASSYDQTLSIPTAYEPVQLVNVQPLNTQTDQGLEGIAQAGTQAGYKADYIVHINNLTPCTNVNALSAEDAADIGAEYLWDMFQADLNGKIIQMSFSVDPSRAIGYWYGDVFASADDIGQVQPRYGFCIEAVSGQRDSALFEPDVSNVQNTFPYKPSDADQYYKGNCDEFLTLAKAYAEKHMTSAPVSAEFLSTGASIAEGYTYATPKGFTGSLTTVGDTAGDTVATDVIEVPWGEEIQTNYIFVSILVTDAYGNQARVSIDTANKTLLTISSVYSGIDYDSGSIG